MLSCRLSKSEQKLPHSFLGSWNGGNNLICGQLVPGSPHFWGPRGSKLGLQDTESKSFGLYTPSYHGILNLDDAFLSVMFLFRLLSPSNIFYNAIGMEMHFTWSFGELLEILGKKSLWFLKNKNGFIGKHMETCLCPPNALVSDFFHLFLARFLAPRRFLGQPIFKESQPGATDIHGNQVKLLENWWIK